jgi:hypothetical protein
MQATHDRLLDEYQITPAQWAILSTAGFYLLTPLNTFAIQAQLDSEEDFSEDELKSAIHSCEERGWLIDSDYSSRQMEVEGMVLTHAGHRLKEQINYALMQHANHDRLN